MSLRYEYTDDPSDSGAPPSYGDNPSMKSNGRGLRDVVQFQPNVPVQLSLKYAKPKTIETKRGLRYMITTQDNRVAFVEPSVALKIEHLEIKPLEEFWVAFRHSGQKGDLGSWDVYLDPATERSRLRPEPPAIPSPPGVKISPAAQVTTLDDSQDTKKAGAGEAPAGKAVVAPDHNPSQIHMGWAQFLISTTNGLTDAYAAALAHARQKHGEGIKPEDVRTLLITAYIQQTRNGGPNHA